MSAQPEFSRPLSIAALGPQSFEANEDERTALSERFNLASIEFLLAEADFDRDGSTLLAKGKITAKVTQKCVVSEEPVEQSIDETFTLRFLPESEEPTAEETELEEDDCETLYYAGDSFDFGEAIAQTMALALDPFPRSPKAEQAARDAGILQDDDIKPESPFAALDGLEKPASN